MPQPKRLDTVSQEFDIFWQRFPRRVGRLAALKAYERARQQATAQELLDGIDRYRRLKPPYADWCHPATFLNQGRWLDQPDAPLATEWQCPHTPRCLGRYACDVLIRIGKGHSQP